MSAFFDRRRIMQALFSLRIWLLLMCAAITAVALKPSLDLEFDRSIESLFRKGDPRYVHYLEDKRLFGGLETSAVAYEDPKLLTQEGLARLGRLAVRLREVPGVQSVLSLAGVRLPSAPWDSRPLTEQLADGAVSPSQLRNELVGTDLYRGQLLSSDGRTTILLVEFVPVAESPTLRSEAIEAIRDIADQHNPPAVLAGGPVLVDDVFRHLEEDGRKLGFASSLVLMLVIAVLFRNLRWIVLPLLVVHVTLVWTKAGLVATGTELSMVSSPLVALVTVIGVATVMHVTLRFREDRLQHPPAEGLRQTMTYVVPAIFWTCVTTAAGFAALLASSVAPVQSFGTMMAVGSLLVFVTAVMLTPGVVMLGRYSTDPAPAPGERRVTAVLRMTIDGVERHPWKVAGLGAALAGLASLGILRLQVATDFNENFRESSPIVQSYQFVADRMGTVGTLDVLVDMPSVATRDFEAALDRLEQLQQTLQRQQGVVETLSLIDLFEFVGGGEKTNLAGGQLPSWIAQSVPRRMQLTLMERLEPGIVSRFWNRQHNVARITVQVGAVKGAKAKQELVERIATLSREYFPSARTAGVYVLLTYVVESLLADQWVTFGLAVAAIFVIMTLAFWSWQLGLAALLANVAPILMVVGTMGWVGLKVNIATAMLASVSMGLAVDFSIHYLYRFQRERRSGQEFFAAMREAHGTVGLAMALANLALIAGFSVLVVSAFVPTIHFGILISVAMLGGLASNLVVLPLLLRLFHRPASS